MAKAEAHAKLEALRPDEPPLGSLTSKEQSWLATAFAHLNRIYENRKAGSADNEAYCIFEVGMAYVQFLASREEEKLLCEAVSAKSVPEIATVLTTEADQTLRSLGFKAPEISPNYSQILKIEGVENLGYAARLAFRVLKEVYRVVDFSSATFTENIPSNSGRNVIDLTFRPASYFWPLGVEKRLLVRIKGTERKAAVQRMIDEGRLDEIPDFLKQSSLTEAERTELGRIHPAFMGGEYLPQMQEEVEIARIEISSTTSDVTSVFAKRAGSRIKYRVVDEYEGETLSDDTERSSDQPLTLGELETFFLGAWPFMDVLQSNFEDDVNGMLGFFQAKSQFYPELDNLLRQRVIESFGSPH